MSLRILAGLALATLISTTVACSSDSDGGGDDDSGESSSGGGSSSGGSAKPLSCESLAFCTDAQVRTYHGEVPAATGGSLADGLYRLDYIVAGIDDDDVDGYFDPVDAILIEGGSFVLAGSTEAQGAVSTSGTILTLDGTRSCTRGTSDGDSGLTAEFAYTARADGLSLHEKAVLVVDRNEVPFVKERVYRRVSGASALCEVVASSPSSPGSNSAQCASGTCTCSAITGGTLAASECPR